MGFRTSARNAKKRSTRVVEDTAPLVRSTRIPQPVESVLTGLAGNGLLSGENASSISMRSGNEWEGMGS